MDSRLRCACGRYLEVAEGSAGTEVSCACGRRVQLPSLIQLRSLAGLPAQDSQILPAIEEMLQSATLPTMRSCCRCDAETNEVADVNVTWLVEKTATSEPSGLFRVLAYLAFVYLLFVYLYPRSIGRKFVEVAVRLPVRICPACYRQFAKTARFRLIGPAIGLVILGSVLVFWSPWWAFLFPIALFTAFTVVPATENRQVTIEEMVRREPIYNHLLDRFPGAMFLVLRVDK